MCIAALFAVCLSKTTVYVKMVDNDFISLYMSRFDTLYEHGRMIIVPCWEK